MKKRIFYQSLVKSLYLCLILLLLFLSCVSQQRVEQSVSGNYSYPQFPDGEEGFRQFILENVSYPPEALGNDKIASMVVVCQVGTDGIVKDVFILNGWDEDIGETVFAREVRNVLSFMPVILSVTGKYTRDIFFIAPVFFSIYKGDEKDSNYPYLIRVNNLPRFPGGEEEFARYLKSKMRYSFFDRLKNKERKMKIEFVMTADGSLSKVEMLESISPKYDEMVLDILENMPKWMPGSARSNTSTLYHLTISYLSGKKLLHSKKQIRVELEDFGFLSEYQRRFDLENSLFDIVRRGTVFTCMPVDIIGEK